MPLIALISFLASALVSIFVAVFMPQRKQWWIDSECSNHTKSTVRRYFNKGRVTKIRIGVPDLSLQRITVIPETRFLRMLKMLGLFREPLTGRVVFDHEFFVATGVPRLAASLGQNAEAMNALRVLLQGSNEKLYAASKLIVGDGFLWTEFEFGVLQYSDKDLADYVAPAFQSIQKWLEAYAQKSAQSEGPDLDRRGYRTWVAVQGWHAVGLVLGFVILAFDLAIDRQFASIEYGGIIATTIAIVVLYVAMGYWLARLFLGAGPYLGLVVKELLIMGILTAGTLGFAFADSYNRDGLSIPMTETIWVKPTKIESYQGTVESVSMHSRRRSRSYSAQVTWRSHEEKFGISSMEYMLWKQGDLVTVVEYRGALGDKFAALGQ